MSKAEEVGGRQSRPEETWRSTTQAPSGHFVIRLTPAAQARSMVLLPRPGSPSTTVILRSGIQPGHSQETGRTCTTARWMRPSDGLGLVGGMRQRFAGPVMCWDGREAVIYDHAGV